MSNRSKATLGALALVGLGFALGILTDHLWLAVHSPAHETQEEVRARLLEDMRATVDLSEEQMQDVHTILNRYQLTVTRAWDEVQPHLDAALDSAFDEIHGVLSTEQAREFHAWFARTHPRRVRSAP